MRFLGPLGDEELRRWLRAADVFASPSRTRWGGLEVEGFGIVFLEAMANGKAVVAARPTPRAPPCVRIP